MQGKVRSLVWDVPTRVTHWLIVLLVTFSWLTAEKGWFGWHRWAGYAVLTLVLFRMYWGFSGSTTARFANFLRGPRAVGYYVRRFCSRSGSNPALGHNPLGGWSALAMLLLLLLQCTLGLFAVDVDGIESGPLSVHVSFAAGRRIAELHGTVFNVLVTLVGLHIVAVFVHLIVERENLIAPMLTGIKSLPHSGLGAVRVAAPWRALLGLLASALLVFGLVKWL